MRTDIYPVINERRRGNFPYKWLKRAEQLQKRIVRTREELEKLDTTHDKICFLYIKANEGKDCYKFYKMLRRYVLPKPEGLCEICKKENAYCKHHIIPLNKGGNNRDENLIDICLTCHNAIHPFMHGSKEFDYPETYRAEREDEFLAKSFKETVGK